MTAPLVHIGGMEAYHAVPSRPNGAGIVLAMSVWGLVPDLIGWADFLAALGYDVIAPNLYWRAAPGHAIDYDMSRLESLTGLMASTTDDEGLGYLKDAAGWLKNRSQIGRLGVVGWCYGGRLACLAAADTGFDAAVAFYPTAFETRLDVLDHLHASLQVHLPERERFATVPDAVDRIVRACTQAPRASVDVYPGTEHGFGFSPPHPHHHFAAARLAATRACLFLQSRLVAS